MINIRVYQLRRYYIFYAIQFTFGYTGNNQQISSYGKWMGFPFDFPQYWKIQQNHPAYRRTWEISTHTFPQHRGFFSHEILILLYTSPHGKWIGFLINFTQHRKMQQIQEMEKVWEIVTHTFFIVWMLFSISYQSFGILHHMGNAWISSSISHSTGICNKIYCIGRA